MTTATITPDKIEFTVEALPEDMPVEGNCSAISDDIDRQTETDILEQLEAGNEWAWCIVRVTGEYHGLTAHAYLGGCSYDSAQDFETNSGHFEDMCAEVAAELNATFQDMCEDVCEEQFGYVPMHCCE